MGDLTRNLSESEFHCKCGCGHNAANPELVVVLQEVVDHFMAQEDESVVDRISITINSGNRCAKHNKAVGGSPRSRHITGEAADFRMQYLMKKRDSKGRMKRLTVDPTSVADYLDAKHPNEYGVGWYHGRTHVDVSQSGRRRWDMR